MKKLRILLILFCVSSFSIYSQDIDFQKLRDSLALESRGKADKVLEHFDNYDNPKLLYSIADKDYYILIKEECKFKEFYLSINNQGKIIEKRELKLKKRDKKYISKAFKFKDYHTDFIKEKTDATFVRGKPTYFVVKDTDGNRFGEYRLAGFTLPTVIDGKLYGFLTRKLTQEISKSN